MISICKRFKFDAAHHLPYYKGPCHRPHGHRWFLDVKVSGEVQQSGEKNGMIMDFTDLKEVVNNIVINKVDHYDLNDFIPNPTAETMVEMFANDLQIEFGKYNMVLEKIKLYETEDAYAEWRIK